MAGDRKVYEKAMNAGHSAAWDQDWDKAIPEYGRAVQEFPEDPDAHRSLGLALLQARRLDEALKVYTRAHQLAPDDPIPLEKSADVLERMGRLQEAAQQYIQVADIYISQRELDRAIGNWERATHLTTGLIQIHAKLGTAYERTGENKKAIREYLTLAFNFQRMQEDERALQAVERALRLDGNHAQALNTKQALLSKTIISAPVTDDQSSNTQERMNAFIVKPIVAEDSVGDADPRGPMGEAEEKALADLANAVFQSGLLSNANTLVIQALELHRQHDNDPAIALYQQAGEQGFDGASLNFSLGNLLLQNGEIKQAIEQFSLALTVPGLAAGAHHGLGKAHMEIDEPRKAARHLVETLRMIDLELAISNEEREQLNAVYNKLQSSIPNGDEEQLRAMNTRFFSLLTGKDWKQRVAETRRQLEETADKEDAAGMMEQIAEGGEELTHSVAKIDRYIREGYLTLAIDEAHYAIELAPTYLPVHIRIAEVLLKENHPQAAVKKYRLVADAYIIRDQTDRAAGILNQVLEVAPMDLEVRTTLIKMLKKEERWTDVLEQYIDMADAYYQLTDFDQARETYQEARELAEDLNSDTDQITHILHRIADIDVTRFDLRKALHTYRQIKVMAPNDERTRKALMDLNYRLGDKVEATKELDELMRLYAQQNKSDLIARVLEEQVAMYPKEMALRSRLAALYSHFGRKADAVAQLDALGELQLDAGMHSDAAKTIRQIVSMNPPGVDDYKRMLKALGG